MRLAIASQRINASFQELKDAMEKFMGEQAKEKALVEKASRVRAGELSTVVYHFAPVTPSFLELGIAHTLCLPGTRARTLDAIRTWATPGDDTTPQVLCLVGAGSHGKSTIASTIACEWEDEGRLYGAFFFVKNPETPYKSNSARIAQPTALRPRSTTAPSLRYSIASLSQLGQRFPSSSKFRKWTLPTAPPSSSSNESSLRKLNEAIKSLSSEVTSVEEGQRHEASSPKPTFLVIDNLDDLPVSEINQVVSRLREALVANPQLRVLLTARTKSAEIVERNNDGGGEREGRETEGAEPWWAKPFMSANKTSLSPSRALFSSFSIERASSFSSSKGDNTEDKVKNTENEEVDVDIETYIHSRMCFSLSASEQQRLVNAAGGCIGTAVRLCDALEDAGSPERVLDVVLYREMVQKHGENIRVVLV
ncbi:hypothetical protein FRC15_000787 [Serendipita sp. 397]|nr:hypothetical protein FRC15_000787 [Serendipita sp. 397]